MRALTKEQANKVYDILESTCQAYPGDRDSFVYEYTSEDRYHLSDEWRFSGALGFGGKFRFPRMTVDCYQEDETPERLAMIEAANAQLKEIREAYRKVSE